MILKFRIQRTTKNTVRYVEDTSLYQGEQQPAVGTLYVQKSALPEVPPQELLVTITPVGS